MEMTDDGSGEGEGRGALGMSKSGKRKQVSSGVPEGHWVTCDLSA